MMASAIRPPSLTIAKRSIRRSLVGTRWQTSTSLFFRALVSTVSHNTETKDVPEPLLSPSSSYKPGPRTIKEFQSLAQRRRQQLSDQNPQMETPRSRIEPDTFVPKPSTPTAPLTEFKEQQIDPSVRVLLPILRAQPPHYVTIHIHEKPYLVTVGDSIRLPFLMHGVQPGDILRLNRATLLGSRDYTLKAGTWTKSKEEIANGIPQKRKWIDERLFTCRACVLGVESEPLRIKEKTKRRQRRVKHVRSKHSYTVIRISELTVHDLDALEGTRTDEGATGGDAMTVVAESREESTIRAEA